MRLTEGTEEDWYESDGKIVVRCIYKVKDADKLLFEYPDFSEEVLNNKSLYIECKCGVVIQAHRFGCAACEAKAIREKIDTLEKEIKVAQNRVANLKSKLATKSTGE